MNYKLIYLLPDSQFSEETEVYNPTNIPGFIYRLSDPIAAKLGATTPSVILLRHIEGQTHEIIRRIPWPNSQNATMQLISIETGSGNGTSGQLIDLGNSELNIGTPFGLSKSASNILMWAVLLLIIIANE